MPDFLEDFNEKGLQASASEDRNFLNQYPGQHLLTVQRFERSKTGRAVVAELVDANGTEYTHIFKLDTKLEWQRERNIRELRVFAGAALRRSPTSITLEDLFGPGVEGAQVVATVAANERGFNVIKYQPKGPQPGRPNDPTPIIVD